MTKKTFETNTNPATHCACCGRALKDVVSVKLGVGPICRANGAAAGPERDLFTVRSDYEVEIEGDVILVTDLDRGGRSVTNDAPWVISDLARAGLRRPGMRVIYRDSRAVWDELVVRDLRFAGFAPVNVRDRAEALAAIAA